MPHCLLSIHREHSEHIVARVLSYCYDWLSTVKHCGWGARGKQLLTCRCVCSLNCICILIQIEIFLNVSHCNHLRYVQRKIVSSLFSKPFSYFKSKNMSSFLWSFQPFLSTCYRYYFDFYNSQNLRFFETLSMQLASWTEAYRENRKRNCTSAQGVKL